MPATPSLSPEAIRRQRIEADVASNLGVQDLTRKTEALTAKLDKAREQLKDLPPSVIAMMLEREEAALEAELARLEQLKERARASAVRSLAQEQGEALKERALPSVTKAQSALETARLALGELAAANAKLRALGCDPICIDVDPARTPRLAEFRPGLWQMRI